MLSGQPVPLPWPALGGIVKPRGQNLMLVLAAPGVGKSSWSAEWLAAMDRPSLYVSLDQALVDHAIRLIARKTAMTIDQIQEGHDTDLSSWVAKWQPFVEALDYKIRFCDSAWDTRAVSELVHAETEYWGEPPVVTVIDNVADLLQTEESATQYEQIYGELKRIAKENDTLMVALHHLKRRPAKAPGKKDDDADEDETSMPVHLTDGTFAGEKKANFVLGLWRPQPNKMRVGVLKNRMGPASSTGGLHITLDADLRRMQFSEPQTFERYVGINYAGPQGHGIATPEGGAG
jgi:hypothetical protein